MYASGSLGASRPLVPAQGRPAIRGSTRTGEIRATDLVGVSCCDDGRRWQRGEAIVLEVCREWLLYGEVVGSGSV